MWLERVDSLEWLFLCLNFEQGPGVLGKSREAGTFSSRTLAGVKPGLGSIYAAARR